MRHSPSFETMTRYILIPDQNDWTEAHFALNAEGQTQPFRIILRRTTESNQVSVEAEGTEGPINLPEASTNPKALVVDVIGDKALVRVEGRLSEHTFGSSRFGEPPIASGENMQWRTLTDEGAVEKVRIGGRDLWLPPQTPKSELKALQQAIQADDGTYLQFIASHSLVRPDDHLTILDIDPSPVFALTAAVLLPGAQLCCLTRGADTDDLLTSLAEQNGLTSPQLLSRDEIAAKLATSDGSVLVQGGQAFDLLGDEIDALPADRRTRLSLWTASDSIIPGNRVLPCASAQIKAPPGWVLNRSPDVALSARRPGLDIAVAAYNARDYLIDCVESLLCDGRDDVRVIIVDDGSTDGSGDEAATHFATDPRVRVERKPNGGCASARNYGRLVSDATHITFVDADDFVTPNMFADLYDLALYSGCEVVQSGFDFYDDSRPDPYYPSYEEDQFRSVPREQFGDQPVFRLQARDIIKSQPSIWRRVYRRAFLDARNIYFPENVRAFDDYIFQMFSLTAARDILMLPEHKYHYRQHPAQDIKQGDERHFYMIYMFHMLLARSIDEAWPDFRPYAESVIDCISWSSGLLRPDLTETFLGASARFCVAMSKTYGNGLFQDLLHRIEHPDFMEHYQRERIRADALPDDAFWSRFRSEFHHPVALAMRDAIKKAP